MKRKRNRAEIQKLRREVKILRDRPDKATDAIRKEISERMDFVNKQVDSTLTDAESKIAMLIKKYEEGKVEAKEGAFKRFLKSIFG